MYTLSLKLETELNIIALQTFPKMLRVLYAHIIKKEPLRTGFSIDINWFLLYNITIKIKKPRKEK